MSNMTMTTDTASIKAQFLEDFWHEYLRIMLAKAEQENAND